MKASEVLALVQAGYTKAEIEAMEPAPAPAPAPVAPAPVAPAPAPVAPVAPEIVKAPEPTIGAKNDGVFLSDTQFNTIMQSLRAGAASIDVPPTYDVNKVLGDHFTSLMLGEGGKKNE